MMPNTLVAMLDDLAELRSAMAVEGMNKLAAIQEVLSAEQQVQLAGIDAEFDERMDAAKEKAGELEARIKEAVLAAGASVRGKHIMAVFSQRTKWDTKYLLKCAEDFPPIKNGMAVSSVVSLRMVEK